MTTAITDRERIVVMLNDLHSIATDYDAYEYGLPMHDEEAMQKLIDRVTEFAAPSPQIPDGWQIKQTDYGWSYSVTAPTGDKCLVPNTPFNNMQIVCRLLDAMIAAAPKSPEAK